MKQSSFISPNIRPGLFNRVGTRHFHVDCQDHSHISEIAHFSHQISGFPSRGNTVFALHPGPQRESIPEAYSGHHPAQLDAPENDSFTSTALDHYDNSAAEKLLIALFSHFMPITIELEEVVLVIGWDGSISRDFTQIDSKMLTIPPAANVTPQKFSFEYHHSVNIQKQDNQPNAHHLVQKLSEADVVVGSIYVFDAGEYFAYRTNAFIETPQDKGESIILEAGRFRQVMSELGYCLPTRTTLERVVGIWQN